MKIELDLEQDDPTALLMQAEAIRRIAICRGADVDILKHFRAPTPAVASIAAA